MTRILVLLVVLAMLTGVAAAQEHAPMAKIHTMTGYLVDKNCGQNMARQGPEKAMVKAKKHTRMCGLMEDCAASGYGLVSGGKFFPLDAEGNKRANAYLQASTKENDIEVAIAGTMDGETINVQSITDVPAAK